MNPFEIECKQVGSPKKKVFCCRVCYKNLASKSLRTQHELENHPKNRPFSCTNCKNGFFSQAHLRSHMKVHTKAKVLHCFECCFSTKWKSSLERHQILESHHINKWQARNRNGNVPAFHCDKCNDRRMVKIPNYNLVILNVRDADGSVKRIRFQPPTKESREWLKQRRLASLKRKGATKSVEVSQ